LATASAQDQPDTEVGDPADEYKSVCEFPRLYATLRFYRLALLLGSTGSIVTALSSAAVRASFARLEVLKFGGLIVSLAFLVKEFAPRRTGWRYAVAATTWRGECASSAFPTRRADIRRPPAGPASTFTWWWLRFGQRACCCRSQPRLDLAEAVLGAKPIRFRTTSRRGGACATVCVRGVNRGLPLALALHPANRSTPWSACSPRSSRWSPSPRCRQKACGHG
jgi:hypothetical protein